MGGSCCVPLGGVTAYPALFFTVGRLHAAQTILVIAAGSRISTLAVCLAAQAGARVLVTSSSEEKLSRAGELGADAGVLSTEARYSA